MNLIYRPILVNYIILIEINNDFKARLSKTYNKDFQKIKIFKLL